MKPVRLALTLLFALAVNSHAIDADDPANCRHQINQLIAQKDPDNTQSLEPIEVLVWNVQKFQNPSALTWLKETSAQVIMTQESIASIQEEFARTLSAAEAFSPGYRTLDERTSGVGIITKLEPLINCAWQHEEPWLLTPKATLISALRTTNKVMLAVNLHAINFTIGTDELQDQLKAISVVIDQYNGPIVVAGDFNTWSRARTTVLEQFIQQHELNAAHFEPDHRVRPFSYPLDHILTKNVDVLETRSEDSAFSDHNPLMLTISPTRTIIPRVAYQQQ